MQQQAGELAIADSKEALPDGPADKPLGTLCFQMGGPDEHTGQVDLVLWPRLAIRNELPFPVEFLLEQEPELKGGHHLKAFACVMTCLLLLKDQSR